MEMVYEVILVQGNKVHILDLILRLVIHDINFITKIDKYIFLSLDRSQWGFVFILSREKKTF